MAKKTEATEPTAAELAKVPKAPAIKRAKAPKEAKPFLTLEEMDRRDHFGFAEAVKERDYTLNPESVIYRAHDGKDYQAETISLLSDGARKIRCITNQPATSGLGDFVAKQGVDPGQWRFA